MRVSGLDSDGDWRFGKGKANYLRRSEAIQQNVITRLRSFTDDWFLNITHGLPWIDMLGSRNNETRILREIERVVLSTEGVRSIEQIELISIDENRKATIHVSLIDIYGDQYEDVVIFTTEPTPPVILSDTVTIAAGAVASDLAGFIIKIDMADLSEGLWSRVRSDGGNLRIKHNGDQVPQDIVWVDPAFRQGIIYFKATLYTAVDNVFAVEYGDTSLTLFGPTSLYGRNAVWVDRERAYAGGDTTDRTGSGNPLTLYGDAVSYDWRQADTHSIGSAYGGDYYQGIAWDGTYWYVGTDNSITKYDASWVYVDRNTDPIGDTGISGPNHCGGLCVHNGEIYVPIQTTPTVSNQYIAVFDTTDLSFKRAYDIRTYDHRMSCMAYWEDQDQFVISDYDAAYAIHVYPTDFSSHDVLVLDTPIYQAQGIAAPNAHLVVIGEAPNTFFSVTSGGEVTTYENANLDTGNYFAGCTWANNRLWVLESSGTVVREYGRDQGFYFDGSGDYGKFDAPTLTQWTVGTTFQMAATSSANQTLYAYGLDAQDNVNRSSIYIDTAEHPGLYNSTDGWLRLDGSGGRPNVTLSTGTLYRVNTIYNGTTSRHLAYNGTVYDDSGVVQMPGSSPHVVWVGIINHVTDGLKFEFEGYQDGLYLYDGNFSDNWISAEDTSWRTPSTFYTVS